MKKKDLQTIEDIIEGHKIKNPSNDQGEMFNQTLDKIITDIESKFGRYDWIGDQLTKSLRGHVYQILVKLGERRPLERYEFSTRYLYEEAIDVAELSITKSELKRVVETWEPGLRFRGVGASKMEKLKEVLNKLEE